MSNEKSAQTHPAPQTPPADPTDLVAQAISHNRIELTWKDNSDNEDGFRIERSEDGTVFDLLATIGAVAGTGTVVRIVDGTVSHSTTYYYRVRAYSNAGFSNWSDPECNSALFPCFSVFVFINISYYYIIN